MPNVSAYSLSMVLKKTIAIILLFTVTGTNNLFARDKDFGVWLDLAATRKVRSATIGLMGEFYTLNNSSSIERTSIGLEGNYSFLPCLNAGVGYLLMNYNHPAYDELRDRFYFHVEPSWHFSNFFFSFRERLQITLYPETRTSEPNTYYWSNRFDVCYKNSEWKLEPLINIESFYLLGDVDLKPFDEFRFMLGANYRLTRNQSIKFYGLYTDETDLNRCILGVAYEIKL